MHRRLFLALAALGLPILATAGNRPLRIVMLGDSLTAGLGLGARDALPSQLQALLREKGHDIVIVNAGVSGNTIADGLARLDWTFAEPADAAIVALGANDMLRGKDPDRARADLDRILTTLAGRGLPVLLCGMLAGKNFGPDYEERFNRIFPDLAAKYDLPLYPFLLDGVALDPALNQPDMLHPNKAGAGIIAARLVPSVEDLIRRIRKT